MSLLLRYRNAPLVMLAPLPGLDVRRETDAATMAEAQQRPLAEMERRFAAGHRAYLARLDGEVAAWGWVATREATIGELGLTVRLEPDDRYLWNFVTRPSHRGRGIYPRLLQAILLAEAGERGRFWIAHAPENGASASGIRRAGFAAVAQLSFDAAGRPALRALDEREAGSASRALELVATADELTPCWRCVRAGRPAMSCAPASCRCDYQRPERDCA